MTVEKKSMDEVYRRRHRLADKYSLDNPGNRFNFEILRGAVEKKLKSLFDDLAGITLLDLGAGELFWVEQYAAMGLSPEKCLGADILLWRLKEGRKKGRRVSALAASASCLPIRDESIDVITQMTMMTSVLDNNTRKKITSEMMRVVKPGGYILWYDFRFNNPTNPDTRAIGLGEIKNLFAGWPVRADKITLLPQLARKLGGISTGLLKLLSVLPILNTHYLATIGPKGKYES